MNSHFSYQVTQEHSADLRRQAAHAALVAEVRKPRRPRIHLKIRRGWLRGTQAGRRVALDRCSKP